VGGGFGALTTGGACPGLGSFPGRAGRSGGSARTGSVNGSLTLPLESSGPRPQAVRSFASIVWDMHEGLKP
jgi:hypothetical protein